jgi:hypothetical protein
LLVCAQCTSRLTVADPGPERLSHYYQCTQRAANFGERVCLTVQGRDVDAAVERTFLAMVTAPPLDTLLETSGMWNERATFGGRQLMLNVSGLHIGNASRRRG